MLQDISNKHVTNNAYIQALPKWKRIRDFIAGQDEVKAKTTEYLPMPNSTDKSSDNKKRYADYIDRAVYFNTVGHTHETKISDVFDTPTIIELPPELEPMQNSVGNLVTLEQQAQRTLGDVLALGRAGLLTDYPQIDRTASKNDISQGIIKPSINHYEAECILDWATEDLPPRGIVLTYVLLRELTSRMVNDPKNPAIESVVIYEKFRALKLINNVYTVHIFENEVEGADVDLSKPVETFTPRDFNGNYFTEIPFSFIGSQNNDNTVDKSPLIDITNLAQGHYRNSADYEDSVFLVGQPTPVFGGLTKEWVNEVMGDVKFGSRAMVVLPENATAELLQAEGNSLAKEAMDAKERQMEKIGARLVSDNPSIERTALEAAQSEAVLTSSLGKITVNVNMAFNKCLHWAAQFVGADISKIVFKLNTDFSPKNIGLDFVNALMAQLDRGLLTVMEFREIMRHNGLQISDDDTGIKYVNPQEMKQKNSSNNNEDE